MEEIEEAIREYENRIKDLQEKVDIWKAKKDKTSIENSGEYLKILEERQKLKEDLDKISQMRRLIDAQVSLSKRKPRPPVAPPTVIDKETLVMLKRLKKYLKDERKLRGP